MDDLATLQAHAVRALGDVLRATDTRPADRLRAAEALLRASPAVVADAGDVLALADAELLRLARGEGVYPPQMGPAVPAAGAVPSNAVQPPVPPPGLVLPEKGEKGDPKRTRNSLTPAGGPKEDPPIRRPRGRPRKNSPEPWM